MKKRIFLIAFVVISINAFSQISISDAVNTGKQLAKNATKKDIEKHWFSTAEFGFILPSNTEYSTSFFDKDVSAYTGFDTKISNRPAYEVLYTINYPVLNKLSLGAITGFLHHGQSKVTNLKIGGILRYHFVDYNNVNFYLMIASMVSLNDNAKGGFGNVRLGLDFPIVKGGWYNITLNGFWDYASFTVTRKLFRNDEQDGNHFLFLRSYGIGIGVQF